MVIMDSSNSPLADRFFAPLTGIADRCPAARSCPELPDLSWLHLGITRVLEDEPSGRAFLQSISADWHRVPARSSFFDSLASRRRLRFCREANAALCAVMARTLTDPLAAWPGLAEFAVFAGDGHFHAAAVHDPRQPDGTRHATGHLYALDLRTHAMHHIDVGDQVARLKEHDMRTLKRQDPAALRMGTPAGRKVLIVWDRAGIDLAWWYQCKHRHGIYFLSRPKDNMVFEGGPALAFDAADPVNTGVLADELVAPATHMRHMRRITFIDPVEGVPWQILTNEHTLAPGLLVKLYRMRWDIEKVYDEFKNKLLEKKAWATSATAKCMQGEFLCLAHNLMVLHEDLLLREHGIVNEAENRRREKRLKKEQETARKAGRAVPLLRQALQRCTQRTVKFVRWLRVFLFRDAPWTAIVDALRMVYRTP